DLVDQPLAGGLDDPVGGHVVVPGRERAAERAGVLLAALQRERDELGGVVGELAAGGIGEPLERPGPAAPQPEAQRARLAGVRRCADDLQRHGSSHLSTISIPFSASMPTGLSGHAAARRARPCTARSAAASGVATVLPAARASRTWPSQAGC